MYRIRSGFTLIELLVVISIITILSVVGLVSFQNVRKSAQDAKVKADLNAIKKAYEVNYDPTLNGGQGGYKPLADSNFAGGKIPTQSNGSQYPCTVGPDTNSGSAGYTCTTNPGNAPSTTNATQGYQVSGQLSNGTYTIISNQGTTPASQLNSCDPGGLLIDGLVGYWNIEEGSGGTTADSVSPSTQGGTLSTTGVSWTSATADRIPNSTKALNFDGSSGTVKITSNSNLNPGSITISFWAKATIITSGNPLYQRVISKPSAYEVILFNGYASNFAGNVQFKIKGGNTDIANTGSGTFPSDKWNHIVATFDSISGNGYLYINTQAYVPGNSTGTLSGNSNPLGFGAQVDSAGNFGFPFKGIIDKVRIYNKAVGTSVINLLYNGGNGC